MKRNDKSMRTHQLLVLAPSLWGQRIIKAVKGLATVSHQIGHHSVDSKYARAQNLEIWSDPLVMPKSLTRRGMVIYCDGLKASLHPVRVCVFVERQALQLATRKENTDITACLYKHLPHMCKASPQAVMLPVISLQIWNRQGMALRWQISH